MEEPWGRLFSVVSSFLRGRSTPLPTSYSGGPTRLREGLRFRCSQSTGSMAIVHPVLRVMTGGIVPSGRGERDSMDEDTPLLLPSLDRPRRGRTHYDRLDGKPLCLTFRPGVPAHTTVNTYAVDCMLCLRLIRKCKTEEELERLCEERRQTDHLRNEETARIRRYKETYKKDPVYHLAGDGEHTYCGVPITRSTRLWDERHKQRICDNCSRRSRAVAKRKAAQAKMIAEGYQVLNNQSIEGEQNDEGCQTV